MRKLLSGLWLLALLGAASAQTLGPGASGPCSAFGTTAGTCAQGNAAVPYTGAASAVNLNGQQLNNVIIGTTTPLAGLFTTLNTSGIFASTNTTSGTSTTAAALTAKSLGLTENAWVGGTISGNGVLTLNTTGATLSAPVIGTIFQTVQSGGSTIIDMDSYGGANGFSGRRANGTISSPTATLANSTIISFSGFGFDGSAFSGVTKVAINLNTGELWSSTAQGTYISFLTTPLTTTARAEAVRIQPSGGLSIGASAIASDPGAGNLNVAGTTASTSTTTGALTVAGGLGVAADAYVGGSMTAVGQLVVATGTPTIASGACGTGTNGTIVGDNQSGIITIGAIATTSCAVTFSKTLANAPKSCVAFPGNATAAGATILAHIDTIAATGFTLSGAVLASTKFNFHCY